MNALKREGFVGECIERYEQNCLLRIPQVSLPKNQKCTCEDSETPHANVQKITKHMQIQNMRPSNLFFLVENYFLSTAYT